MRQIAIVAVLCCGPAWSACGPVPPAIHDIDANSYYSDSRHSLVDPERKARNEAAVRPVNDYLDGVARFAGAFQRGGDMQDARCALGWLDGWAGQDALLGTMKTEQSFYTRKWTLAGLALSYARVRGAAAPERRARIDAWLLRLADATIRHSDAHKGVRNNHYYWEGLAVSATGALTGDARCLAWGRGVFDHAMGQVQADGSLPLETARGRKALSYHLYAAAPLAMMASILNLDAPALDRLVAYAVAAIADPAVLEQASGAEQERPAGVPGWIAIYLRHGGRLTPPPRIPDNNWDARMGGDRSLLNPLEHPRTAPAPA